jgi:hypothetical protein
MYGTYFKQVAESRRQKFRELSDGNDQIVDPKFIDALAANYRRLIEGE